MTMVVGCHFPEGIVLIADSRASWIEGEESPDTVYQDILQKILPLAEGIVIGFAGDVKCALAVMSHIHERVRSTTKLRNIRILGTELSRHAKNYYRQYCVKLRQRPRIELLLAGLDNKKKEVYLWIYESPIFSPKEVKSNFAIIGSGALIEQSLNQKWATLFTHQPGNLKAKADWLFPELRQQLEEQSIMNVGGLFQILLIDETGVRPLTYGSVTLDPDQFSENYEMRIKRGVWEQVNITTGDSVKLRKPLDVLRSLPERKKFKDYKKTYKELPKQMSFLNYFIVCGAAKREYGTVEFFKVSNLFAAGEFPIDVNLLIIMSFRTGTGKRKVRIRLVDDSRQETFYEQEDIIEVENPIEDIDLNLNAKIEVTSSGPYFLELFIDEECIASKALVFAEILDELKDILVGQEDVDIIKRQEEELFNTQGTYSDPVLEKGEKKAILNYFVPCSTVEEQGTFLRFEGMIQAIYSNSFPQTVTISLPASFRASPGRHHVKIDLIHSTGRERQTVATGQINTSAYFRDTPVHGSVQLSFPIPGPYLLEFYVDDELCTRSLVLVEDVNQLRFIDLLDNDKERVRKGEVLFLVKGAKESNAT